ncbi:MAG TPA: MATE family efflux transporter, partial [Kiritimatiellia bacterium]|nr:MATE family efflux transporter [Kiritimatiellia bacterium]
MDPSPSSSAPATDSTSCIGTDPILRLLLRFSIPSIVGMLVHALYNIVDRMFIGHGIGAHGLAG